MLLVEFSTSFKKNLLRSNYTHKYYLLIHSPALFFCSALSAL